MKKQLEMAANMERTDSSAAMAILASYADPSDSEDEEAGKSAVDNISDEEAETRTPTPVSNIVAAPKPVLDPDNDSRSSIDVTEQTKARKKKSKLPLLCLLLLYTVGTHYRVCTGLKST